MKFLCLLLGFHDFSTQLCVRRIIRSTIFCASFPIIKRNSTALWKIFSFCCASRVTVNGSSSALLISTTESSIVLAFIIVLMASTVTTFLSLLLEKFERRKSRTKRLMAHRRSKRMNLAICFKSPPWNVLHMTRIVNSSCLFMCFSKHFFSVTRHLRALRSQSYTRPSGMNADIRLVISFFFLMRIAFRIHSRRKWKKELNYWWKEMWRWPLSWEFIAREFVVIFELCFSHFSWRLPRWR